MSTLFAYFQITLITTFADEAWNCANPRPFPRKKYEICQWYEHDFKYYKGSWYLRPRDMHDNYFEAYVRKKYWIKKGYDNSKIRLRE